MPHLYCARCGFHVAIQAAVFVEDCPRCLVRHATVTPLALAEDWGRPIGRCGLTDQLSTEEVPTGPGVPARVLAAS
jgi:hypothetical protein